MGTSAANAGLLATVKDGGEMKEFERKINPDVPVAVPPLPPPARHIIDNAGGEQSREKVYLRVKWVKKSKLLRPLLYVASVSL